MQRKQTEIEWLNSKETARALRISGCHLMHLRVEGRLRWKKEGNAFFYLATDVEKAKRKSAT